jgi:SAM-dependent methyltransferase
MIRKIKKLLAPLAHTPIHPQWFITRNQHYIRKRIAKIGENNIVLDIGCAGKWAHKLLPGSCYYVGVDYLRTARDWYKTKPDIYGDALSLPIADESISTVLLLDVMEHLPAPSLSLSEAFRVLKENGHLILQVPFLYPIHDAPRDYQRWTKYGFSELALRHGFTIEEETYSGQPLETGALISNIAVTKTVLNWISKKHLASILVVFLPLYVLINNLMAWILAKISYPDDMMPTSYQMVWRKDK